MKVLSVDPASTILGWAIYDYDIEDARIVSYGEIDVSKVQYDRRYTAICAELQRLHNEHKVDEIASEMPFRSQKFRTDALGVACMSIKKWTQRQKLPFASYPPPTWKAAVIGNGNATKSQVMATMELLLTEASGAQCKLNEHEADALAIGEYHVRMRRFELLAQKNQEEMQKRIGLQ